MLLRFTLRFKTMYGQSLWISGSSSNLGNGDVSQALPMQYLNEEFWRADVKLKRSDKASAITYYYFLKNEEGEIVKEWENDRTIQPDKSDADEIECIDTWNHAGEFENSFYTAPFAEVLLKKEKIEYKAAHDKKFTHWFKVKAPLLATGEVICILGSGNRLADWSEEQPVLLEQKGNWWMAKLNLGDEQQAIAYKYAIYNISQNKLTAYENGDNRILYLHKASAKTPVILHDGFIHLPNNTWKGAGVAIPVFSLRSHQNFGVGEFSDIKALADWASQTSLKLIQLLPVNDTIASFTWHDSYPYSAVSAYAFHPLYINLWNIAGEEHKAILETLYRKQKKLNEKEVVDYEAVLALKLEVLVQLYELVGEKCLDDKDFKSYHKKNKHWLNAYAAFCFFRDKYKTAEFDKWGDDAFFNEERVKELCSRKSDHYKQIGFYFFTQYHLHLQLKDAVDYAHNKGIVIKGDIPIGISRNSCDAWMAPSLYNMKEQAGAPPDDFTAAGQNWGFPTYNWQAMQADGFAWWKKRFAQMSDYFDAFRIDHILGFFRIWSVPVQQVQGIMGRFEPCIPVHINEFSENGIWFDHERFCTPFITDEVLHEVFGDVTESVKQKFLSATDKGTYGLLPDFTTQREVENYFAAKKKATDDERIMNGLFDLIANVILFEETDSYGQQFHFRIDMEKTSSFRHLIPHVQQRLKDIYVNYFYRRQDGFWQKEAMHKLPMLKASTNMLVCGEDLGMVPHCVPDIMAQLGILSLEIQRMPKDPQSTFFIPSQAPYLSVITPSTHDMSTIREWWQEDNNRTQIFYNTVLGQQGTAPAECEPWICRVIILQHLHSPAMWSIFQLQDLLSINDELRRKNPQEERINNPANPKHYWQYRMHLYLEQLLAQKKFNDELSVYISQAGR